MTETFPAGGTVASSFEAVRTAFIEAQKDDPGGAQLCVYRNGEKVVDLWAGRDPANDRPYGAAGIGVLMSCTKGFVAGALHMLAERGLIDLEAPAARYWPEFGQGGKGQITVRQLIAHQGGLMGYDPEMGMDAASLFDWEPSVRGLEAMTPLWEPGSGAMYHAVTFGTLAGELIRRVDGRMPGRFIAEEIAGPLGLDFWIGLPEAEEPRRVPHFTPPGDAISIDAMRAFLSGMGIDVEGRLARTYLHTFAIVEEALPQINDRREWRVAELPAGNGIGNAEALARYYAALIGEVDGVRLLGAAAMERARQPQDASRHPPPEFAALNRDGGQLFGLGFELASMPRPMLGAGGFGHSGAGGRLGYANPELCVSVGYACNTMRNNLAGPDIRWVAWTKALEKALGA
jgi:CubicO group peptidase (beta-lactamase class C family)